ncbi:MAG TPA: ferric reductase-like transmembrane domain-containing protein [Allosphingosinicella sp.]|uniref:ferric reductase-like transmembrane domain-containing protein n=1 Tax=Allosphingosinicella sp. TaxID=2823234 RepID=UPI002F28CE5E
MTAFVRLLAIKPLLWVLLAIPGALMVRAALEPGIIFEDLLHPSGEWSARLLIVALMLTPLSRLLPGHGWVQWLLRRRRAFGVAAFAYALLHLLFYLLEMQTLRDILAEIGALGIWTGWLAFMLMVPIGLTSNDASMRALKAGWKRLQRLAYPAALLTLAHWMFVHDNIVAALINFAPLGLLQAWRIVRGLRPAASHPRSTLELTS